jgi:succinate-semialdehyde dehydrogenase/glutarate-semialdehyde dehydrogenase
MPWNFPFWQVIRFAVPTLLAGNTVLLKHASNVSLCSIEIHKLFCEALSNEHIFQSLLFKAADADKILRSGLINGVSVTGSEEAGRKVGESAGTAIIKQVYELGGNDAFIVFEKVDIQETVKEAVKARLINCGQSCISAKRFIIHNNIFDEFVGELTTAFRSKSFGNPLDKQTRLAPLAKKSFAIELEAKVDSAINNKALALLPNHRDEAFLTPNILLDVNEYNPIYDEEIFGPIAIVHRFNTIEEAIQKANSSRYGLSSSVWSEDLSVANFVATQLECGSVYINTYPQSDSAIPFGGVKYSGYGREMGRDGMLEFVNRKAVVIN